MRVTFEHMEEIAGDLRAERVQASDDLELRALEQARVDLAVPRTEALTAETLAADPGLRQYVLENVAQDFSLVRLSCSFKLNPEEPFLKATLAVDLRAAGGSHAAPLAWSMMPLREATARELSDEYSLGAKLKLGPAELEGQRKEGEGFRREDVFLEALAEGTSEPAWEFNRTKVRDLRGTFRLAMVVQSPRGAGGAGRVSVATVVKRRKFGPITYRAVFRQKPMIEFLLPVRP